MLGKAASPDYETIAIKLCQGSCSDVVCMVQDLLRHIERANLLLADVEEKRQTELWNEVATEWGYATIKIYQKKS